MTLRHMFTWILVILLFVGAVALFQPIFGISGAILIVICIVIIAIACRG